MRYFLFILSFLTVFISCQKKEQQPPNIVLFFVDDMGWQDTSVPFWNQKTPLNERYHTPNMERLAAMGVKFTNAYSTPVCSPTRVSLMTGMNAARHRVTNWTLQPDQQQPMESNHPNLSFPEWNYNGIARSDTISHAALATPLPQLLKDQGYYTIHVGKAHFGALGYPSENPIHLGFDINIAGHAAGAPESYLGTENFGNGKPNKEVWAVPGLEEYHGKDIFLTQALTEKALQAVSTPLRKKQPFFLYFALYGVHTPLMADTRFAHKYEGMGLPPEEIKYASMVESMDNALGNLLNFLEEKAIANQTVVLFMSDNGGLSAVARGGEKHQHNAPLKSGKGSIYEGGIRVPMLALWPGITKKNSIEDNPVIIEDFFPTLLDIAGVKSYQKLQAVDGQSFAPLLEGKLKEKNNRPLFWHYPNAWGPSGPGIGSYSAVRNGNWKLIYFHEKQELELYNLSEDIGENDNLAFKNPDQVKYLAQLLTDHLIHVNAQMPAYKETGKQVPWPVTVANATE